MCTELDEVTLRVPVGYKMYHQPQTYILHNDLDDVTQLMLQLKHSLENSGLNFNIRANPSCKVPLYTQHDIQCMILRGNTIIYNCHLRYTICVGSADINQHLTHSSIANPLSVYLYTMTLYVIPYGRKFWREDILADC